VSNQSSSDALRTRINTHPILDLPAAERSDPNSRYYLELNQLLLQYFSYDRLLFEDDMRRHEDRMMKSLSAKPGDRWRYFDTETYILTLNTALAYYDNTREGKKNFTNYFVELYGQKLPDIAWKQYGISAGADQLSHERHKQVKLVLSFIDKMQWDPQHLSEEMVQFLADEINAAEGTNFNPKKIRKLLADRQRLKDVQYAKRIEQQLDEESDFTFDVADQNSRTGFLDLEEIDPICAIIDLMDPDEEEWPRLFLTHGLLKALKESDGSDHDEFLYAYRQREDKLLRHIMVTAYLQYVLITPPEPDSITNIDACALRHELIQKTIAKYLRYRDQGEDYYAHLRLDAAQSDPPDFNKYLSKVKYHYGTFRKALQKTLSEAYTN